MLNIDRVSDLRGNATVLYAMNQLLERGKFPKFTIIHGQMGVGKTTAARLIAKELLKNDPMASKPLEFDVALGVNLQEIASTYIEHAPAHNQVIIFEEFHAFDKNAQTALLNMIDRQPPTLYIICTTTELHKILRPLQSRAQLFEFRLLRQTQMAALLNEYLESRGESLDPSMKEAVLYKARGIPRDMLKDTDLLLSGDFTSEQVNDLLGFMSDATALTLFLSVKSDTLTFIDTIGMMLEEKINDRVNQLRDFWTRFILCRKGNNNYGLDKTRLDALNSVYASDAEIMQVTSTLLRATDKTLELELIQLNMKLTGARNSNVVGEQAVRKVSASTERDCSAINAGQADKGRITPASLKNIKL